MPKQKSNMSQPRASQPRRGKNGLSFSLGKVATTVAVATMSPTVCYAFCPSGKNNRHCSSSNHNKIALNNKPRQRQRRLHGGDHLVLSQYPLSVSSTNLHHFFSSHTSDKGKKRGNRKGNARSKGFNQGGTEEDDDFVRTRWIRWMMGGQPRGTNKIILREAEELGGVPRSERYSSQDWLHSLITLPNSNVLYDIRGPVVSITAWSTILSLFHHAVLYVPSWKEYRGWASHFHLNSMAPHSLMMSVLGLLLVFRTNSAYQRFAEGRKIWETIINSSRDLYRMIMLYEKEIGMDKRRRVQKLLAAFPYLLRHRIRPNLVMRRLDDDKYERDPENTILLYQDQGVKEDDEEAAALAQTEEETGHSRRKQRRPLFWVDKRSLPWRLLPNDGALEKCARAQNRPLWVCDRMAQELRTVPDGPEFTNRERCILISHVDKLSHCIGGAERIHQTVVPLNYARHTLRALTVWLFSLPFVLVRDLKLLTGPVVCVISWLLFGIFEVSCAIEDPFQGTLRLSILCDTIRRDVLGDEHIRSTAFRLNSKTKSSSREYIASSDGSENENATTASKSGLNSTFE